MRFKYLILSLILLLNSAFAFTKVADLKPEDIHLKVNEFLHNHISQKKLTKEIMKRAIHNFVDYLDPLKLYFTQEDIHNWLEPSEELLESTLTSFYKSDFAIFESIYNKMLQNIDKRNLIEKELNNVELIKDLNAKQVEDKEWTQNTEELKSKLLKIRSLQAKYSEKLGDDFKDKFFVLIEFFLLR